MENITLYDAMNYIDTYLTEATTNKKQKILDNQTQLKNNFNDISKSLRKSLESLSTDYSILINDKKFFKNHEDHKEQHYLLVYTIKPTDDLSSSKINTILSSISNKVEKEFKSKNKEFINKGLYFDNKKKDDTSRFFELHYDFY